MCKVMMARFSHTGSLSGTVKNWPHGRDRFAVCVLEVFFDVWLGLSTDRTIRIAFQEFKSGVHQARGILSIGQLLP